MPWVIIPQGAERLSARCPQTRDCLAEAQMGMWGIGLIKPDAFMRNSVDSWRFNRPASGIAYTVKTLLVDADE